MNKAGDNYFVTNKAILVNPQGKVLMLRDAGTAEFHKNAKGFWDYPGGCLKDWESPLECLAREVKEETGIEIDTSKARLFHQAHWLVDGEAKNGQMVALFYIVPVGMETVTISSEHDEHVWIDPRQPLPSDMAGSAVRVLEDYKRHESVRGMDERVRGHEGYGLIQVIHGNGKGKTTASLGQAVRCAGAGKRVAIIYFDKGGNDHYSERSIIDRIDGIDYWATGRDRIDPKTGRFDFSIQEIDKTEARRGLDLAKNALTSGEYDLVVLDELNPSIDLGMVNIELALDVIEQKADDVELIITGRNPHKKILELANLITNMELQHHYFYSGVKAREGLDF